MIYVHVPSVICNLHKIQEFSTCFQEIYGKLTIALRIKLLLKSLPSIFLFIIDTWLICWLLSFILYIYIYVSVIQLDNTGKLDDAPLPALSHGCGVVDFKWDPFNDSRLFTGKYAHSDLDR